MSWKSGNRGRERLVHARLVWRPKTRSRPGFPLLNGRSLDAGVLSDFGCVEQLAGAGGQ